MPASLARKFGAATALKRALPLTEARSRALKRRATELERQLRALGKNARPGPVAAANDESIPEGTRFSAKSLIAQRKRLGLSAADLGLLMGASTQSIYNWESGKARPHAKFMPTIVALRSVGKKQTLAQLEALRSAA